MVGKPRSCTACRQAKMGCDARGKAPNPCSRCASRNIPCRFDKNFKRVSTRQIARDIADRVHTARASQDEQGNNSAKAPPLAAESSVDNRQFSAIITEAKGSFLLLTDLDDYSEFSLAAVSVPSGIILDLLKHFDSNYYAHAPFIQHVHCVRRFASDSPILFWAIILIASQHHERHGHLYQQLFFPHLDLLAPVVEKAPQSIESVQALLLLCLWPIPRRREVFDPSWTYVGIAVNSCIMLNLHKPLPPDHPIQSLMRDVPVETQLLTWLACFGISTRVAIYQGFTPPLASPHHLRHVRKAVDQLGHLLSPEQRATLAINELVCSYSISLEDMPDAAISSALTTAFNRSLDGVKETYGSSWSPNADMQYHSAKLNLFTLTLWPPIPESVTPDVHDIMLRQALLLQGLESACNLIKHMEDLSPARHVEGQDSVGRLTFCPKFFFTDMFFAAIFLLRLVASHPQTSSAHRARASQAIGVAHGIFCRISSQRGAARAARLLHRLAQTSWWLDKTPDLSSRNEAEHTVVTNRLGASVLWDTVLGDPAVRAARQFRIAKRGEQILPLDLLPPTPDMKPRAGKELRGLVRPLDKDSDYVLLREMFADEVAPGLDREFFWET